MIIKNQLDGNEFKKEKTNWVVVHRHYLKIVCVRVDQCFFVLYVHEVHCHTGKVWFVD